MSEKIIAYKATDKNMMCRGKQYEVGKTYTEEKADCCTAGMHACEVPFDVLHYYHVSDGVRVFQVECGGEVDKSDEDSKFACTELTVKGELKLTDMLKIGVEAVMKRVKEKTAGAKETAASGNCSTGAASGYCSTGAASGYYSTGAASGDCSTGAASGDCSSAEVSGKNSIAVANGYNSKARGSVGCYIVLTEYDDDGKFLLAKMARVDGTVIKDGVWYTLKNGEFVEAE
nr:MAG TPA: hypothetical protein [Caudoviricetes sp.]